MKRTTEDIVRELLNAPPSTKNRATPVKVTRPDIVSNIGNYPDLAFQEMDSLIGDDADDKANLTRRIAAANIVAADNRDYVSTAHGQARRAFDDHGDPNSTRAIARRQIDLAEWAQGQDRPNAERDRRALALHEFAREINRSTMEHTLPSGGSVFQPGSDAYAQSADSVANAIASRSENAKGPGAAGAVSNTSNTTGNSK